MPEQSGAHTWAEQWVFGSLALRWILWFGHRHSITSLGTILDRSFEPIANPSFSCCLSRTWFISVSCVSYDFTSCLVTYLLLLYYYTCYYLWINMHDRVGEYCLIMALMALWFTLDSTWEFSAYCPSFRSLDREHQHQHYDRRSTNCTLSRTPADWPRYGVLYR